MNAFRLVMWNLAATILLLAGTTVQAQNSDAAPPQPSSGAVETKPGDATETPADASAGTPGTTGNETPLSVKQDAVAQRYRRFEKTLRQMAEYMRKTDPDRANLLYRAINQSSTDRIAQQLDEIVLLLAGDQPQYGDAVERQNEADQFLQALLNLLQSEDRNADIKEEQKRLEALQREVNRLIAREKEIRNQTNRRPADAKGIIEGQQKIADDTKNVVESIDRHDTEKNGESGKGKDPKQQEGKSGKQDGEPKEGQEGGDSSKKEKGSDQEGSESKDGEKNGEKQDGSDKPTEEQSNGKKGSDGKSSDEKQGDGKKPNEGEKPVDGDSSDPKSKGKPGEQNQNGKSGKQKSGDQQQQGDQQQGEQQDDQQQQGQQGQQHQGQQGQQQQGGQQGEQSQQQDQSQEQGEAEQSEQQSQQTPGREEIEKARKEMEEAIEKLKSNKSDEASAHQDEAVKQLMAAKEKLEEILRQLREEERELMLAALEARFQKMLAMQVLVNGSTVDLSKVPKAEWTNQQLGRTRELSGQEEEIALEANKALNLLKEEGSSVAFPEAVTQIHQDMVTVARRLERGDVGELTQGIEQDIVESLKEIIEALRTEMEKLKEKQQQQQQQQQKSQKPGDKSLVDDLAELKMLRSLQHRINRRTKQLGAMTKGEQATDPDAVTQLQQLSQRQASVQEATYDLAAGKNR